MDYAEYAGRRIFCRISRCWHPANISELGFALQLNSLARCRSAILPVRVSALSVSVSLPPSGFLAGITAGRKMTRTVSSAHAATAFRQELAGRRIFFQNGPRAFKCRLIAHDHSANLYSDCQTANTVDYPAWLSATRILSRLNVVRTVTSILRRTSPLKSTSWQALSTFRRT
jgi:hypothetical protein